MTTAGRGRAGGEFHMDALLQSLCIFCAVTTGPHPQVPGIDIRYSHERVGPGLHLLRLSTTDLILDWNQARKDRLHAFAEQFANDTCRGRFKLGPADNPSWPKIHTTYAKQFVFRCV
jgi:hypothetical protein